MNSFGTLTYPTPTSQATRSISLYNLTPGVVYYVSVEAFNSCGWSYPTADLLVTPGTCPDPPVSVYTANEPNSQVSCSWVQAPGSLNGFPLSGYEVSI